MPADIPDEQAALLAAIVAQPDEDTPRLVYADWLQENGDEEQAQFIRDSIALDGIEDHEDEKRQAISNRLDEIAARRGTDWLRAIGVEAADPIFDRGMAEGVVYDKIDEFIDGANLLFTRVPVREVSLGTVNANLPNGNRLLVLATMVDLTRLRALRVITGWEVFGVEGWADFITSPYLANLKALAVCDGRLTDDDVQWFEQCEHLAGLEELDLSGNWLTAMGALTVVRSPGLPNLQRLSLADNGITEDRSHNSAYLALIDSLHERFDGTQALRRNDDATRLMTGFGDNPWQTR